MQTREKKRENSVILSPDTQNTKLLQMGSSRTKNKDTVRTDKWTCVYTTAIHLKLARIILKKEREKKNNK